LDRAIYAQETSVLREEWMTRGVGVIVASPGWLRFLAAQSRPAYADPAVLLDVRARRATAHALDRSALALAILGDQSMAAETIVPASSRLSAAADQVAARQPYDPRRVEQLMQEVGYARGADGVFTSATEGRFSPQVLGLA